MEDSTIKNIKARQIFDSRGLPTVEVDVETSLGVFRAAVPSGASTGKYQALQLRDNDKNLYLGKGVSKAVSNVNDILRPALLGKSVIEQQKIDRFMVEQLDGSKNQFGWSKSKLGANAILAVSLAVARAGAAHKGLKLYEYLRHLAYPNLANDKKFILPCPAFNLINGGKHGGNNLAMQQFMILPTGAQSFQNAMRIGVEVYHHLKKLLQTKYGLIATNVGDEGGFSPPALNSGDQALQILIQAIKASGHQQLVQIGMDCAASQFFDEQHKKYNLNFKNSQLSSPQKMLSTHQLCDLYIEYTKKYPIISIQDPFDQDDVEGWKEITQRIGENIQIVGDDLLVTNKSRIETGIKEKHCNALLLKVNQIGSLTEAIEASLYGKQSNWGTMVSHRSGETEDTFIADLVVGLGCGQIKTGAPARSERLAKYNQLLRIEEQLGEKAIFAGKNFKYPYKLIE